MLPALFQRSKDQSLPSAQLNCMCAGCLILDSSVLRQTIANIQVASGVKGNRISFLLRSPVWNKYFPCCCYTINKTGGSAGRIASIWSCLAYIHVYVCVFIYIYWQTYNPVISQRILYRNTNIYCWYKLSVNKFS